MKNPRSTMKNDFLDFQGMLDEVYLGIDRLFKDAQKITTKFYNEQSLHRTEASWNRGSYVFRVKESSGSFSFTLFWEQVVFISSATSTKKRRKAIYIKPNQKGGYSLRQFNKATKWEIELIEKTEEEAKKIRKHLEYLGRLHRTITDFAKSADVTIEKKLFADRNRDFIEKRKQMKKLLQSMA